GGVSLLVLGEYVLDLINSNTSLLSFSQIFFLLLYNFVLTNHQRSTNYISLSNVQPYVNSYIISSILSILFSFILMYFGVGIWGLILSNLIVQISYNGWKWPKEAFKRNKLNLTEMISRTISILKQRILKFL